MFPVSRQPGCFVVEFGFRPGKKRYAASGFSLAPSLKAPLDLARRSSSVPGARLVAVCVAVAVSAPVGVTVNEYFKLLERRVGGHLEIEGNDDRRTRQKVLPDDAEAEQQTEDAEVG